MSNYKTNLTKNAAAIGRMQVIQSAEKLILHLCGKDAYARWLAALPEWATLSTMGGVSNTSAMEIARDDAAYESMIKVMAAELRPVLEV